MKFFSLILLLAVVSLAAVVPASGQVVRTVEAQSLFSDLSTTDAVGNLLVTGDLLTTATPDAVFPVSQNNDILSADPSDAVGLDNSEVSVAGSGPYTYAFASAVDISQIDVYTAWGDARAGQNLEILLSTDGVNFTSLINYNEDARNEVVLSSITETGGLLGSGITHIRFTPGAGLINGDGGVFREIDVIGTVSVVPLTHGDVNQDGVVNFLDISPFIAILSAGGFQAEADCDLNGEVNFLDISPFITRLSGS